MDQARNTPGAPPTWPCGFGDFGPGGASGPVPGLAPALAKQVVRAALLSLINSLVEALTTDLCFVAAITAKVRRTTSRVAEAVLFEGEVPLPLALCATLEAAAAEILEHMEVAEDTASSSGRDSENLIESQ